MQILRIEREALSLGMRSGKDAFDRLLIKVPSYYTCLYLIIDLCRMNPEIRALQNRRLDLLTDERIVSWLYLIGSNVL